MVFSVSSVLLAYVFGIIISTLYVRNLKLVGAGFFWMMMLTQIVLAAIAYLASGGVVRFISVLTVLLCSIILAKSIADRKLVKSEFKLFEKSLYFASISLLAVSLFFLAKEEVVGFDLVIETARLLVGGLLLGLVTTAMLLGHWYLVQPGLTRKPISKMCVACIVVLVVCVMLWLVPVSMISVLNGNVSDGWGGTLGYMWVGSCLTTAVLLFAAYKALQEKSYSAVMATTGLLYLAILVVNGVELIPRAIFS